MDQIFVLLYPLVVLLSVAGYLPQIAKLVKVKEQGDDQISLKSWYTWIFSSVISLGYGVFHLQDFMFCLSTGLCLVLMLAVVGLVLYNRHYRFRIRENLNVLHQNAFEPAE